MKKFLLKVKDWIIQFIFASIMWCAEIAWIGVIGWLLIKTFK